MIVDLTDINSFVKLKYEILTSKDTTWHLCKTYPHRVRVKWALRCAKDVMHLASHIPEVATCIETTEKWLDGKATDEEVKQIAGATYSVADACATSAIGDIASIRANAATYSVANAAYTAYNAYNAAYSIANAAYSATHADIAIYYAVDRANKWDLYIQWLIEELAEWEMRQSTEDEYKIVTGHNLTM
jgi:hypothetical protein